MEIKPFPWDIDPNYKPTIRASSINNGTICPGRVFLQDALNMQNVDLGTSATNLGTLGHEYLEIMMMGGDGDVFLSESDATEDFALTLREAWAWFEKTDVAPLPGDHFGVEVPVECSVADILLTGHIDLYWYGHENPGHINVIDYKFYTDPSQWEKTANDLQMIAYAVTITKQLKHFDAVTVAKVYPAKMDMDAVVVDAKQLAKMADMLAEKLLFIWDNREKFNVGAHCSMCLARSHCNDFKQKYKDIEVHVMAPYVGGEFLAQKDVFKFLVALPALEQRLNEAKDAAKRWVLENGPIVDVKAGLEWKGRPSSRDEIRDHTAVLNSLAFETDVETAMNAAKTTKGAIETALKKHKKKPADRRAFFDGIREMGLLEKKQMAARWGWRKLK